jgi:antitoxin (DNA-binding transcriptional repressor) of toxin-antitoxin stability system
LENVRSTRRSFVITIRGKPVAKLVPINEPNDDFIGRLQSLSRCFRDPPGGKVDCNFRNQYLGTRAHAGSADAFAVTARLNPPSTC